MTRPDRWILGIADDLTGALEAGSKFAAQGLLARVTTDANAIHPLAPIFVVDSETRHLSPVEARRVVQNIATRLAKHQPWLVYKKTDSTLRGNIAAELGALTIAFPGRHVLYVPAYPAMGRIVKGDRLLVHGVPVHETEFASDPLNPIRDSAVQSVLGDVRATIVEGESDEDILAVARRICASASPVLVAGPAAIAEALALTLPFPRQAPSTLPPLRRCLIVNGSMHPASTLQIDYAREHDVFNADWTLFDYDGAGTGVERAVRLGERVRQFISGNPVDGLIVFGGDTAFGIHKALSSPGFTCYGDVLPAVPASQAGGLYWVTKAGGFGQPNLLQQLRLALSP